MAPPRVFLVLVRGVAASLLAVAGRAAPAGQAADAIAVVVHPAAPTRPMDAARLEAIFGGTQRSWPDGKPILAFNLPTEDHTRATFDQVVLHMDAEQVSRYWIDQRIRSGQRPPRQVSDPVLAVRLIGKLPGSIGYVPAHAVDGSVRVVAQIRAGKVGPPLSRPASWPSCCWRRWRLARRHTTAIPPDSVMCTDPYTGFGYACNSADDCPCGLDFCVIYSGQTYCTKTGCDQDPSICPQGYGCVDLSAYVAGLKHTCMKQ